MLVVFIYKKNREDRKLFRSQEIHKLELSDLIGVLTSVHTLHRGGLETQNSGTIVGCIFLISKVFIL
jgi:hypothetical protein